MSRLHRQQTTKIASLLRALVCSKVKRLICSTSQCRVGPRQHTGPHQLYPPLTKL